MKNLINAAASIRGNAVSVLAVIWRCTSLKTEVFENALQGEGFLKQRYSVQVWTGKNENAMKTLVWIQIFLCVFGKMKTKVFENALVWTRLQ